MDMGDGDTAMETIAMRAGIFNDGVRGVWRAKQRNRSKEAILPAGCIRDGFVIPEA